MSADQTTFTLKVCPKHGPFVWTGKVGDDGVLLSRGACPETVDYDGITCAWGMDDEGEKIEVQRVA